MPKKTRAQIREQAKKRVAKLIPRVRKAARSGTKQQKKHADQLTGVARAQGVKVGKIRGRVSERKVAHEESAYAQRSGVGRRRGTK